MGRGEGYFLQKKKFFSGLYVYWNATLGSKVVLTPTLLKCSKLCVIYFSLGKKPKRTISRRQNLKFAHV